MNLTLFGKAFALWFLLLALLVGRSAAQDIPTVEKIRELMGARESALTDAISAQYSVSEKKLPGKNEWYRLQAGKEPSTALTPGFPDNSIEFARDCWLELNGAKVKLALIESLGSPPYQEEYRTDGNRSWHYFPGSKSAVLLAEPITPQMLVERNPWLPAYLTTFPTNMTMAIGHGPTLSELLSPTSGNRVQVKEGDDGDWILEIRSAIRRSNFKDHDFVRRITLGKRVGFAPTHYVVYVQVGAEVFAPSLEASYENFMPAGSVQVPRRIVVVTSRDERIGGKPGDPLKVADFQDFKIEELTVTINALTTAARVGPETFVFQSPPGTTVRDEPAERKHAMYLMWCRILLVAGMLLLLWRWYFGGLYPRRALESESTSN